MDKPKVKDAARGRWKAILPLLGISRDFLTGKHGPCPMCEGTDRWRFDDKNGEGTWFCSHCGAGDGVKLIMTSMKLDFKEAAQCIEAVLNGAPSTPAASGRSDEDKKAAMNDVWRSGRLVDLTSVAGRYLNARTGLTTFSADLRAVAQLRHYVKGERVPTTHPALIAKVRNADGEPINIHRTYLAADGGKAAVDEPRKAMTGPLANGAAIRLAEYTDVLGIAEGIETALSAMVIHGVPCWAATTAIGLEQWKPPPGVRVIIFGDNDPNLTGHKASFALGNRLKLQGIEVDVMFPSRLGDDWNDVLGRDLGKARETVDA